MTRGIFAGGGTASSTELNDCFDPPRARVRWAGAAPAIVTAVATALAFDTETYDVGGCHDPAVNNSRITCPAAGAGLWTFSTGAEIAANAAGRRELSLRINGALYIATTRVPPTAADATRLAVSTEYRMVAGDYVEAVIFQSSGGNLNVTVADAYSPFLTARWTAI